ncbi:MAG: hypothetical protein ACI9R8_000974, partial [Candidatus Paceibacteria bacterium]
RCGFHCIECDIQKYLLQLTLIAAHYRRGVLKF